MPFPDFSKMKNSELYLLAGRCLVLDEKPEFKKELIDLCKNNLIDWLKFVSICSDNLILQVIFLKFRAHGILEYIPVELKEHLQEIYKMNSQRNNEILDQIKSITTILNKKNIVPLFLKGSGNLLDVLYSHTGERLMGDIDFLVPEKDYLISAELMLDAGYLSYMDRTDLNIIKEKHYPRLYHPNFPADIEIHRIPNEYNCKNWFNSDIIYAEKKEVNAFGKCHVQSDKHKIVHNFIHAQLDHRGLLYGKVILRYIYDLYLLSKRIPLTEALDQIKPKRKAIAYFAFAKYIFDFDDQFFPKKNVTFLRLKKKHTLHQDSNLFHQIIRHFAIFIEAFQLKRTRQIIIAKYTDVQFYKNLFVKKTKKEDTENK